MEEKKSSVKELTSNALRVRAYRERKKAEIDEENIESSCGFRNPIPDSRLP